eukprot:COSAG03_NODE_2092_length_3140_cov_4.536994_5_plen_49_part_00
MQGTSASCCRGYHALLIHSRIRRSFGTSVSDSAANAILTCSCQKHGSD